MPLARINLQASIAMLMSAFSFKLADEVLASSQHCALHVICKDKDQLTMPQVKAFLFPSGMANRLCLPLLAKGRGPLRYCKGW